LGLFQNDFDIKKIEPIYNNFDIVCDVLNSGINCVCHGDFHADNILLDNGRMILSDWQNINISSSAGDISFFISRGKSSGLIMNEDELIDYYCKRFYYYSRVNIKKEEIYQIINASNVFTSFIHWPFYLKGADIDRVRGIFENMLNSFYKIKS
jgi:thiamine kinase-like enzyme